MLVSTKMGSVICTGALEMSSSCSGDSTSDIFFSFFLQKHNTVDRYSSLGFSRVFWLLFCFILFSLVLLSMSFPLSC